MRSLALISLAGLLVLGAFLLTRRGSAPAIVPPPAAGMQEGPTPRASIPSAGIADVPDSSIASARGSSARATAPGTPLVETRPERGSGPPVIVGRLLEAGGTPYADAWFHGWIHRGTESLQGTMVWAGRDGSFRHELGQGVELPIEGAELGAYARTDGLLDRRAEITLPRLAAGTHCDVGDLVLLPFTGWIRGSVSDSEGQPVPDTRVEASTAAGEPLDRARIDGESGAFVFDLFEIDAALEEGVALEARADGWFQREPVIVRERGAEVHLVLERGGRIEGALVLDPDRGRAGLSVGARPEAGGEQPRPGTIEDDGSFAIAGLDSGSYAFELSAGGGGMPVAPLVEVPGIAVQRGETTRDPRLASLSLAALLRTVLLRVVDRAGASVSGATVYVLDPDAHVLSRLSTRAEPLALFLPADRPADALVVHEDHRPQQVALVAAEHEIVLKAGIRVFLKASRPVQLDQQHRGALLRLRPDAVRDEPWPAWACDVELPLHFGGENEVEISCPFPGLYRLHVMVLERMGTELGMTPSSRYVPLDVVFDVFEQDAGRRRELDLPANLFELAEQAGR